MTASAGWSSRPSRLLSLSARLLLLLFLAVAAAALLLFDRSFVAPASLVSLIPFLTPPPTSLVIVSLVRSFPPPSQLNSTDELLRHDAVVAHLSLDSFVRLVSPQRVLLLSPSADACHSLSLYGPPSLLSAVVCRTVPPECEDNQQHAPMLPCAMSMVAEQLAAVQATYVALLPFGAIVSPELLATVVSLADGCHTLSSHSSLVLTGYAAYMEVAVSLVDRWQSYTAEQMFEALVSTLQLQPVDTTPRIPSESSLQPPRAEYVDLLVLPSALLPTITKSPFVWSGVAAKDAVWRRWLLSQLYTNRRVVVVQAEQDHSPLLLHPLSLSAASSPTATAASTAILSYNERMADERTSRLTWRLDLVRLAPYTVCFQCPEVCRSTASLPSEGEIVSLLFQHASTSNYVMLIDVSEQTADEDADVERFLCWAERVSFDAWVMAVRSDVVAARLKERGVPVVSYGEAEQQQQAVQLRLQRLTATEDVRYRLWLNGLVDIVLHYNVSVMLTNAAVIPLSSSLFSQLQSTTNYHLAASLPSATDSTASSRSRLPAIVVLSASAGSTSHVRGERTCLNALGHSGTTINDWTSCVQLIEGSVALSSDHYVDLDDYSSRRPSTQGHVPLLVHSATSDPHLKAPLLQQWEFTLPTDNQCTQQQAESTVGSRRAEWEVGGESVVLQVRVLTFDRAASLRRLLQSLSDVDWRWTAHPTAASLVSTIHIHFVISIDVPTSSSSSSPSASTASTATEWCANITSRWPSLSTFTMSCTTLVQPTHLGLVGQWTEIPPPADNEVLAVLEDDLVVTSVWFRVVMDQLVRFHYQSRDPRLVSLALQHPLTVVGETSSQPYGTIQPAVVAAADCAAGTRHSSGVAVSKRRCYFYYQLIGTWGAAFLPAQYGAFSRWLHATDRNFSHTRGEASTAPCVPSLLSNAWWQRRHDAVWSAWMIRYMYEHGLYSLYSTAADSTRNDSVVVNMREVNI